MGIALKMIKSYFDTNKLLYDDLNDDAGITVATRFDDGFSMRIFILVTDDDFVKIFCPNFIQFEPGKLQEMYMFAAKLCAEYRWIKFFINERESCIVLNDDAFVDIDTCGEEVKNCVFNMFGIGKQVHEIYDKTFV